MDLPFESRKFERLVIRDPESSGKFGTLPWKRSVEQLMDFGIVNIDKPSGPTSHQISGYVKKILHISKCGHSGTLDPKVTGVLPIALGRSTKVLQTLLTAGKEYVCYMHLHSPIDDYKLHQAFKDFTGKIEQLPPVKSAVKRQLRSRTIYYIDTNEITGQEVLFTVGCQAGTYIRKLVHDFGQHVKVGAHMAELRRTKAGPFKEDTLYTLQDLTDAYHYYKNGDETFIRKIIQPIETAVRHLPKIVMIDTAVDTICHGASVALPGVSLVDSDINKNDLVAIMTLKGELVGLATAKMSAVDMQEKERGIAAITDKVLMLPGIYPRFTKSS